MQSPVKRRQDQGTGVAAILMRRLAMEGSDEEDDEEEDNGDWSD